ncbi:MAG TPA: heme o synthase [Candidatus Saccharimonadales bacterium]|nr:heme o synthase [Candidatus Saccharimonadales bacterium]
MIKTYYKLTKPGVLYGNVLTAVAGFLLASGYFKTFDLVLFAATIAGMTLVIASACVLNNVFDRDIDKLMERTKNRGVASGRVDSKPATIFSVVLGILGIAILALWVNWLVVAIGLAGFIVYVWLYGALSKRKSIHGTAVGSVSGAAPILAGYAAVSGNIDTAAILLFLALFFWQFPEFYSIAIFRKKEYAAAKVPVMTVVKGVKSTKIQIFIYTIAFVVASLLLSVFGYTSWLYFVVMAVFGLVWIRLGALGLTTKYNEAWARQMFRYSLLILIVFSVMVSADNFIVQLF